jgi:hypothetical protein
MSAKICWCCQTNLAWQEYDGAEYLDEDGNKPCFECAQEMAEDDDKTLDFE